jgi:thiosulfate/3-mercaptopyruvate sulfurtransferase
MKRIAWLWIVLMLWGTEAYAQAVQYRKPQLLIETPELAAILSKPAVCLLDVRPAEEYRLGHLPGAVNLPAPATDDLEANRQGFSLPPHWAQRLFRMAGLSAGSRVILYDDQGNRFAARVFYVLEFFGHSRVQILNGGIRKWQNEGRATTTDAPNVTPGNFTPVPNASVIATAQWISAHLKDPGVRLVDARSPAEFSGEEALGPRGGHIPGAVNIEWTRVISSGEVKTFLNAAELEKLFAQARVTRNHEVVTYCQLGVRAAVVYFALRLLGFKRVRVYDGSWEDWGADLSRPVEK